MTRTALALLLLASCGDPPPPPAPPPPPSPPRPAEKAAQPQAAAPQEEIPKDLHDRSKSPELFAKYVRLMKDNQKQVRGIQADVEQKKPEADLKKKLEQIRRNAAEARALHYRKPDEDDAKLDTDFEIFDLKMAQLLEDAWPEEKRADQIERLHSRCNTCHETYRD